MKRKKGFTLIELLAVIVILTLIMLIATPLILKMIQTARKEAFRASAYGIMKSAEFKTERNILEGKLGDFISKYENNILSEGEKLDFKGSKPKQGIVVAANGKVSLAITNGVWCARKSYDDTKITLKKYPEEDNCELEMDNMEWEIVDMGISTYGDGWIKIKLGNNDIKYLVSDQLGDFKFEDIEIIDDSKEELTYLVNEFEKFATNQYINNNFGQETINFSDDLLFAFLGNNLYRYNWDNMNYDKLATLEKEIVDIKGTFDNYYYLVQYLDNTVNIINLWDDNIEVAMSYSGVNSIFYGGYIDLENIIYVTSLEEEKNYPIDGKWEVIGGEYVKSLIDGQLYYFDVWEEKCILIDNPTNQTDGTVVLELILLDKELYFIDWENIEWDTWDESDGYPLTKFEGIDENIIDLYQEWLYAIAKTESGNLIYIDCWDNWDKRIISNEEVELPLISGNPYLINGEILDIYSKDLYIDMAGKLVSASLDWEIKQFIGEINNSEIGKINKILETDGFYYYKGMIVANENNEIWQASQGPGLNEEITYTKIGNLEIGDKIEKAIIKGSEKVVILTSMGKVYNIFCNTSTYELVMEEFEIEGIAIDMTMDLVLTNNGYLYNLDFGGKINLGDNNIEIVKLLYRDVCLDINNNLWIYDYYGNDIILSYQEYINEYEEVEGWEDMLIDLEIIQKTILKSENSKRVLFNTTYYPYSIILDKDNNGWAVGFIIHPRGFMPV